MERLNWGSRSCLLSCKSPEIGNSVYLLWMFQLQCGVHLRCHLPQERLNTLLEEPVDMVRKTMSLLPTRPEIRKWRREGNLKPLASLLRQLRQSCEASSSGSQTTHVTRWKMQASNQTHEMCRRSDSSARKLPSQLALAAGGEANVSSSVVKESWEISDATGQRRLPKVWLSWLWGTVSFTLLKNPHTWRWEKVLKIINKCGSGNTLTHC